MNSRRPHGILRAGILRAGILRAGIHKRLMHRPVARPRTLQEHHRRRIPRIQPLTPPLIMLLQPLATAPLVVIKQLEILKLPTLLAEPLSNAILHNMVTLQVVCTHPVPLMILLEHAQPLLAPIHLTCRIHRHLVVLLTQGRGQGRQDGLHDCVPRPLPTATACGSGANGTTPGTARIAVRVQPATTALILYSPTEAPRVEGPVCGRPQNLLHKLSPRRLKVRLPHPCPIFSDILVPAARLRARKATVSRPPQGPLPGVPRPGLSGIPRRRFRRFLLLHRNILALHPGIRMLLRGVSASAGGNVVGNLVRRRSLQSRLSPGSFQEEAASSFTTKKCACLGAICSCTYENELARNARHGVLKYRYYVSPDTYRHVLLPTTRAIWLAGNGRWDRYFTQSRWLLPRGSIIDRDRTNGLWL